MLIGCDVDQVVADLNTEWLRRYNADYEDSLTVAELVDWDISKFVKPACGKDIDKYLQYPHLYERVRMIPHSLWGVTRLRMQGHRVVFLTSDPSAGASGKINWLKKNDFITGPDDWAVLHDKSLIPTDVLIDDSPRNISRSKAMYNLLFDWPWNRDMHGVCHPRSYIRVDTWFDIVEWIARIETVIDGGIDERLQAAS